MEHFVYKTMKSEIDFFIWRIDLTGDLKNTKQSLAQFCQFAVDLSTKKIFS